MSIAEGKIFNGYWKLYARMSHIPICRKCGERLPEDYQPKRIGYICSECKPLADKCKSESQ